MSVMGLKHVNRRPSHIKYGTTGDHSLERNPNDEYFNPQGITNYTTFTTYLAHILDECEPM